MPFEKGNTLASNKGKHQKTKQWEELAESITTLHAERFNQILSTLDDEKFMQHYLNSLNYFKPKYSSATIETDSTIKVNVKIPGTEFE